MAIIKDILCFILFSLFFALRNVVSDNRIQYCPFFNNRAPSAQPNLKNCTWYKENSCCNQQEIDETFGKVKPLKGASKACQSYVNYLMCYICSPYQNEFYQNERLTVCEEFCDVFYEACGSAILTGSHIADLYNNGTQFCLSRRFLVESQSNCFSAKHDHLTNTGLKLDINRNLVVLFILFILSQSTYIEAILGAFNSRISSSSFMIFTLSILFLNTNCAFADDYSIISQRNIYTWAQAISGELHTLTKDALGYKRLQETIDTLSHSKDYINASHEIINIQTELSK